MSLGIGLGLSLRGNRGGPVDTDAPTLSSATIDAAGTTLTLTFSESVTGVSAADFALSTGQALSNAEGSGTTWTLTTAQVYDDETPTLDYSGTAVEDAAGNALAAFSDAAVTNNSTVVQAGTLQSGLQSFWELEEASGTRNDSHGSNDLTDVNTVTSAAGKVGTAASFASASSEKLTGTAVDLRGTDFYLCAWVQRTGAAAVMRIMTQGENTTAAQQWTLFLSGTAVPTFIVRANGGAQAAQATWGAVLTAGVWYFVEAWYDATDKRAYINVDNGTPVSAQNASMGTLNTPTGDFTISSYSGSGTGNFWNGLIDQAGIWTRIPTSAERTYLRNAGSGRSYAEIYTASP